MSPSLILFDLGRVLMHIDFEAFPNGLGLTTEEQRAPYRDATQRIVRAYETGKMTTEEFLDALFVIYDARFSRKQLLSAFNAIIVEDNASIVPFIDQVQHKYQMAILSNTCASHWQVIEQRSHVVSRFRHRFTSFEIGVMKPDPSIYLHVCKTMNLPPQQILFIDDLQENVEGASAVGMHGITYRNSGQLMSDFTEMCPRIT